MPTGYSTILSLPVAFPNLVSFSSLLYTLLEQVALMELDDVLEQVLTPLERDKRRSYREIKRRFGLDDEYLEDLKEELLFSHQEISEPDGRGLILNGEGGETAEPYEALISVPTLAFPTSIRLRGRKPFQVFP